jgi:hypothetical protein
MLYTNIPVCIISAVYVDGRLVAINSGVQLTTCGVIDMSASEHIVLVKYIHTGGYANASVAYRVKRGQEEEPLPLLPLDSVSPGWCAGTFATRTKCFGVPATDQCAIDFPADISGGEVVDTWDVSFMLQTPLRVWFISVYMYIPIDMHS